MGVVSCSLQLAAMVIAFTGHKSMVTITSPTFSDILISSMVLQFKTADPNSELAAMIFGNELFTLNILNGKLVLQYNFNQTGNGTFDLGLVNTGKWLVLNITSKQSLTHINLHESDNAITKPCKTKFTHAKNIILLGQEFSNLLKVSGLKIGGQTNDKALNSFAGCIGFLSLNDHVIDLLKTNEDRQPFNMSFIGTLSGCHCDRDPCLNGTYIWDKTKGRCDCKCSLGFDGQFCNQTMAEVVEDDEEAFVYIMVGVAVGVLLLVTLLVCVVMYVKRTSSSAFGVYNPKKQEKRQGQQMPTAFTLPVPEKLI